MEPKSSLRGHVTQSPVWKFKNAFDISCVHKKLEKQLASDILRLFENSQLVDLKLESAEGFVYSHRVIVAGRYPACWSLLTEISHFQCKLNKLSHPLDTILTVSLPSVSFKDLKAFVRSLYTSQVDDVSGRLFRSYLEDHLQELKQQVGDNRKLFLQKLNLEEEQDIQRQLLIQLRRGEISEERGNLRDVTHLLPAKLRCTSSSGCGDCVSGRATLNRERYNGDENCRLNHYPSRIPVIEKSVSINFRLSHANVNMNSKSLAKKINDSTDVIIKDRNETKSAAGLLENYPVSSTTSSDDDPVTQFSNKISVEQNICLSVSSNGNDGTDSKGGGKGVRAKIKRFGGLKKKMPSADSILFNNNNPPRVRSCSEHSGLENENSKFSVESSLDDGDSPNGLHETSSLEVELPSSHGDQSLSPDSVRSEESSGQKVESDFAPDYTEDAASTMECDSSTQDNNTHRPLVRTRTFDLIEPTCASLYLQEDNNNQDTRDSDDTRESEDTLESNEVTSSNEAVIQNVNNTEEDAEKLREIERKKGSLLFEHNIQTFSNIPTCMNVGLGSEREMGLTSLYSSMMDSALLNSFHSVTSNESQLRGNSDAATTSFMSSSLRDMSHSVQPLILNTRDQSIKMNTNISDTQSPSPDSLCVDPPMSNSNYDSSLSKEDFNFEEKEKDEKEGGSRSSSPPLQGNTQDFVSLKDKFTINLKSVRCDSPRIDCKDDNKPIVSGGLTFRKDSLKNGKDENHPNTQRQFSAGSVKDVDSIPLVCGFVSSGTKGGENDAAKILSHDEEINSQSMFSMFINFNEIPSPATEPPPKPPPSGGMYMFIEADNVPSPKTKRRNKPDFENRKCIKPSIKPEPSLESNWNKSEPSQGPNWNKSEPSQGPNWNKSEPSQGPNWNKSEPSQGPNWNKSEPSQGPNWNKSEPSQGPNWNKTEPSQEPNWNKSEPPQGPNWNKTEPSQGPNWNKTEPSQGPNWNKSEPSQGPNWNKTDSFPESVLNIKHINLLRNSPIPASKIKQTSKTEEASTSKDNSEKKGYFVFIEDDNSKANSPKPKRRLHGQRKISKKEQQNVMSKSAPSDCLLFAKDDSSKSSTTESSNKLMTKSVIDREEFMAQPPTRRNVSLNDKINESSKIPRPVPNFKERLLLESKKDPFQNVTKKKNKSVDIEATKSLEGSMSEAATSMSVSFSEMASSLPHDIEDVSEFSDVSSLLSSIDRSNNEVPSELETKESVNSLGDDLLKMFENEINTDVVIQIGERKIRAHKCILASRCVYFAAMLSGHWVESAGNIIKLQGFSPDAVTVALKHIYSGSSTVPEGVKVGELAALADMLALDGLKEVVSQNFKANMCHYFHKPCPECINGVLEVLPIAGAFCLEELYHKCLKWIAKHFCTLIPTRNFASLPSELQDRCVKQIVDDMSISNVVDVALGGEQILTVLPVSRWAQPLFDLTAQLLEATTNFIASNLSGVLASERFLELGRGGGWNGDSLEDTLKMSCDLIRPDEAVLAHIQLTKLTELEREEDNQEFSENYLRMLERLLKQVEKFIIHNANRVAVCRKWPLLPQETQKRMKDAALVVIEFSKPLAPRPKLSSASRKTTPVMHLGQGPLNGAGVRSRGNSIEPVQRLRTSSMTDHRLSRSASANVVPPKHPGSTSVKKVQVPNGRCHTPPPSVLRASLQTPPPTRASTLRAQARQTAIQRSQSARSVPEKIKKSKPNLLNDVTADNESSSSQPHSNQSVGSLIRSRTSSQGSFQLTSAASRSSTPGLSERAKHKRNASGPQLSINRALASDGEDVFQRRSFVDQDTASFRGNETNNSRNFLRAVSVDGHKNPKSFSIGASPLHHLGSVREIPPRDPKNVPMHSRIKGRPSIGKRLRSPMRDPSRGASVSASQTAAPIQAERDIVVGLGSRSNTFCKEEAPHPPSSDLENE